MAELEQLQASAEQATALLEAISNPKRLLILCILCGSPGTSADELIRVIDLSPSATSQHPAHMREKGLIESQRDTQRILYSIKSAVVNSLITTLKTLYCPQGAITTIGIISLREAQTLVAQGAKLIGTRDANEHLHEHIPETHLAPLPALEQGSLPANLHTEQVIFHCQSGRRTQNAVTKLNATAASAQIWLLEGGIDGWKAAGLPVTKDGSRPLSLICQMQIVAGNPALPGVTLSYSASNVFFLLSGFVGARLVLAGMTGSCGMARLLDIIPWNRRTH